MHVGVSGLVVAQLLYRRGCTPDPEGTGTASRLRQVCATGKPRRCTPIFRALCVSHASGRYGTPMGNFRIWLSRARRHLVRHSLPLAVGGSLLVFDIATFAGGTPILLVGGLASVCYGLVEILKDFLDDFKKLNRLYGAKVSVNSVPADYEPPYDCWATIETVEGAAVRSEVCR